MFWEVVHCRTVIKMENVRLLKLTLFIGALIIAESDAAVCGGRTYDTRFATCCGGVINSGSGLACCGTRAYDSRFSTCCERVLRSGSGLACCGTTAYDSRFSTCCQRVLNSGSGLACCGTRAYDSRFRNCCNGQLCWVVYNFDLTIFAFSPSNLTEEMLKICVVLYKPTYICYKTLTSKLSSKS